MKIMLLYQGKDKSQRNKKSWDWQIILLKENETLIFSVIVLIKS